MEYYRKDGSTVWVETVVTAIRDEAGKPIGLLGVDRDITERRRAQEIIRERETAMRESEAFLKSLFHFLPDAIVVLDREGNILFVNDMAIKIAGATSAADIVGRNMADFLHPTSLAKATWDLRNVKEGIDGYASEHLIVTLGGALVWVESIGARISYRGDEALLVCLRDTTDRKRTEEEKQRLQQQLAQAQRMESIGTLAGGIAHDFNNLLMGIQGHVSLMMLDLDPSHPLLKHLNIIEELVSNGADLTRQLLGFARGGRYEAKPANINDIIEKTATIFGRTKKEITIHKTLENNLWYVELDRGQMEQVFMHLFVNAGHAMPAGGELFITTENLHLAEGRIPAMPPGRYVKIGIRDTGVGMDAATQARVFEP
ncbi:MAG: PAS domain S-box protein, partial [Syntrophales bacterium]|nr:PAS domain S-box protein [Syntrophales bacterium]